MRPQGHTNSFPPHRIPTFHIESVDTQSASDPSETTLSSSSNFLDSIPPASSASSYHLCSTFLQTCFGLAMGSFAACSMVLSLATDSWLFTREPYIFSQEELDAWNITDPRLLPRIEVTVRSGLWRVCTTGIAGSADLCMPIDYTQLGSGRLSGAPTCMAVVGAIRYSTPAFVTALLAVTIATVLLFVGVVQRTVKTLVASFLYVIAGLCLAIAIIVYISAINDEVGYSSRNSQPIDFHYAYGWSFYSVCLSCLASEGTAVIGTMQYLRTRGSESSGTGRQRETDDVTADMLSVPTAPLSRDALRIWTSLDVEAGPPCQGQGHS